jgi:hypothetical protein
MSSYHQHYAGKSLFPARAATPCGALFSGRSTLTREAGEIPHYALNGAAKRVIAGSGETERGKHRYYKVRLLHKKLQDAGDVRKSDLQCKSYVPSSWLGA